ncbi:hypothetical protein [Patulibacter sp. SYSU D01012]|uniref:hypothetical protein n=1 Tax=Patulibacter sp. SYSU D01012 TaxID=2817381 RepID=UPI001B3183B8|nr:hypothetical protein [Patulibacter sp. SYSU D01012]
MLTSRPRRLPLLALAAATTLAAPAAAHAAGELDPLEIPRPPAASPRAEIDPIAPGDGSSAAPPAALETAEQRMEAAAPGDLWAVADAAATPVLETWSAKRGAYVANGIRARMNAEMLLLQSYAALAGHTGPSGAHPERIEALVRLITGPMYVSTLEGRVTPAPVKGHSVTAHAPGFADPGGSPGSMHQALDAVAMRALAAAWQARDVVGLSAEARELILDRVRAVATSPFWRFPGRLLNQINWNADVYGAYFTVTGDPTLLRDDYRRQLVWFADHARTQAYPGGTSNLASGLGFHYVPNRGASNYINRVDTAEYANVVTGTLAYLDQALAAGMAPLPARTRTTLRDWMRRVAYGDWTSAGYLNWDTGKGLDRLHLTQYWILGLRGFAAGAQGSGRQGLVPGGVPTARWLVRQAVARYQARAKDAGSVVLPASDYGFTGSNLVSASFDGLTGTARFASTLAELASKGLASPAGAQTRALPDAYAHDASLGRLAVTTSRYSTAIVRPWKTLRTGGLEPSRLFDARGRALTQVGGGGPGTLGLRLLAGSTVLADTQPGTTRAQQSALRVPAKAKDRSATLPRALTVTGKDSGSSARVDVTHRLSSDRIRTTYRIRNDRTKAIVAELRVPTYGKGDAGSLKVGERLDADDLTGTQTITTPTGARFRLALTGLPATAEGVVVRVARQKGNPQPGPMLRVRLKVPAKKALTLRRTITVPAAR